MMEIPLTEIPPLESVPTVEQCRRFAVEVPYTFAKKHLLLPVDRIDGILIVAVGDPTSSDPLEELRLLIQAKMTAVCLPKEQLLQLIESCYNCEKEVVFEGGEGREGLDEVTLEEDLLAESQDSAVVNWLHAVIREGLQKGASDIHFEPFEGFVLVRIRIDGVLQKRHELPKEHLLALVARLKVMARLDVSEQRLPQDGRIKLRLAERPIDIRISSIPTLFGERLVLRLLDQGQVRLGFDQLQMTEKMLETFKHLLSYPEGMILVTGPTGSGKTTTLYSAISEISAVSTNIMTIEDPIEYKLPQISQMNVHPKIGLTFAVGLKHLLRQDPDVLLIGEIRDQQTAEIAVQAALTGHLLVSTLHTNDAPSAIPRLADMGVEPYLLAASLVGVLAQRLVRTLCPHCKTPHIPSEKEREFFPGLPEEIFTAKGCEQCSQSGYRGRRGVYELMTISDTLRHSMVQGVDARILRQIAIEEGMISLKENGRVLISQGVTTTAEVLRVVR